MYRVRKQLKKFNFMSLSIVIELIFELRSKTINHEKFLYPQLTFLTIMIKMFELCI